MKTKQALERAIRELDRAIERYYTEIDAEQRKEKSK